MGEAAVIKEFLVALGFRLDGDGMAKMQGAIGKVAGVAFSLAASLSGAAAAMTAFVSRVASGAEDMYWASVRTRDSVSNIRDFQLQVSKFGGSAEGALHALEALSSQLRTNPATESYLHYLGVQTRDVKGQLVSAREMLIQIANLPLPYWLKTQVAGRFGVDEKTLLAIQMGALKTSTTVSDVWRRAGYSADQAAKLQHEYNNELKDTDARWSALSDILSVTFMPAATQVLQWTEHAIDWFVGLNRETGGAAAKFGGELVAGIGVFLATATLAAPAIYTMSKAIGVLSGALTGLRAGLVAIGLIGETTPFGWILTGVALLGALAYEIYQHWDAVKKWFEGALTWVRSKYHEIAPQSVQDQSGVPIPIQPLEAPAPTGGVPQRAPGRVPSQRERVSQAMEFFRQSGWTPEQSAGIVANLLRESGMNPTAPGDSGQAAGIAQWHPDRQAAFAALFGHGVMSGKFEEQLQFVNHELRVGMFKAAGQALAAAHTAAEAGAVVARNYEIPRDVEGEAKIRGGTAEMLASGRPITFTTAGGSKNVSINQKTDIHVSSDGSDAGRSVAREQTRVNGDLVRNMSGAIQ